MTKHLAPASVPFLVGFVSAIALQRVTGWWLNSGSGVAITLVALLAIAALVGRFGTSSPMRRAVALWAGTLVGMAAVLFWTGPGTLWPIVLVVAAVLCAVPIGVGVLIGQPRLAS
jgi:hypothetical protein